MGKTPQIQVCRAWSVIADKDASTRYRVKSLKCSPEGGADYPTHHRGHIACPPGHIQYLMSQEGQKDNQGHQPPEPRPVHPATIQKARSVQVHQSWDRETEKQVLSQGHQTVKYPSQGDYHPVTQPCTLEEAAIQCVHSHGITGHFNNGTLVTLIMLTHCFTHLICIYCIQLYFLSVPLWRCLVKYLYISQFNYFPFRFVCIVVNC
jgi:hypothetical protein